MEPDEIIRALRICNNPKGHRCSECPIFSRYEHGVCKRTVDRASAELHEQEQSRIAELETQLAESKHREQAVRDYCTAPHNGDGGYYCGIDAACEAILDILSGHGAGKEAME